MKTMMKKTLQVVLVVAIGAGFLRLLAQTCVTSTKAFTENFSTTTYKDLNPGVNSVAQWPSGPIQLNRLGANFTLAAPQGLGAYIYSAGPGDFNGDGYPDLVGLKLTGTSSRQDTSQLELIWNTYKSTNGKTNFTLDPVTDKTPIEAFTTYIGPAAIVVGDFNGDGLLDFFFMRNGADQFGYTNFLACMYINCGTKAAPKFYPHTDSHNLDFTSAFQNAKDSKGVAGIFINWSANHLCAVDIDNDGDIDLLVASQDKIWLVRNPGTASVSGKPAWQTIANWSVAELSYNQRTGFTGTSGSGTNYPDGYADRGTSCISAADFNNDGNIEIICGTVNSANYLAYYSNDGKGHFTFYKILISDSRCYGPTGIAVADYNNDGRPDIFLSGDGWNTANQQGYMWILLNQGPSGSVVNWLFQCLNNCAKYPWGNDDDMVLPIDYNNDGAVDIILCDANDSGNYYIVVNSIADIFTIYGQAQSTNIVAGVLDPEQYAVTSVRITSLWQSYYGKSNANLTVSLYFTNDGVDWELYGTYKASQIANINNATGVGWYDFHHYGTDLRWRLVLTSKDDSIPGYTNASYSTPRISLLNLEYQYVARQEYSRSSAATTIISPSGVQKQLVIGSSFIYPGWQGQLRAYDVTGMTLTNNGYSNLYTVTSSNLTVSSGRNVQTGVNIYWDAGQILQGATPSSRKIYTAIRANKDLTQPLQRIDFTSANATTLSPYLLDVQNDTAGLINFTRGTGRAWLLGDINHSTPVIVPPPSNDAALWGSAYATFKTAYANRSTVVYVGSNDGMLHCFDVNTGAELWGFIPYNLLPKLTNQWKVDSTNGNRFYYHNAYVDGSPSVSDVLINGSWRTVLVCGQGPGEGSTMDGGLNYYFALDVTDPTNPQPLWEFTHKNSSGSYTTGQTISVPAIGQINISGTPAWVAIMGSGYDNIDAAPVAGNTPVGKNLYIVRIDTGQLVWTQAVTDVDTSLITKPSTSYAYANIPDAIVASPSTLDTNSDGLIESVYVGDLDGRLYKLDLTNTNPTNWSLSALYTDNLYYPIVTKPTLWVDPFGASKSPYIFFGTGGDDNAPAAGNYAFIAIQDTGTLPAPVQWYIGSPTDLNLPAKEQVGDPLGLGSGYKVWADPVSSDFIIYFSTLQGSIENVNPCLNLGSQGRLYARILRPGAGLPVGGTALKSSSSVPPEYLTTLSKARQAVTLGSVQSFPNSPNQRQVFTQEYNSAIEELTQPVGSYLQIKSWREIYQIIH